MKKLLILTFILLSIVSNSQNKSGKAIYKVVIHTDSVMKKTMRPILREKYERAENDVSKLKLELTFSDTVSVFISKTDNNINDLTLKIVDCEKMFFTNLKSNEIMFTVPEKKGIFRKNEFLVHKEIDNDWILTNETKHIQNFKCYKATQEILIKNDEGSFYRTVTAWYCPEFPFTFGPKGYCNLPGLIFELHDKNVVFGLEEISIYDKPIKIDFPVKGTKISDEKYIEILKDRVMKRMELMEK